MSRKRKPKANGNRTTLHAQVDTLLKERVEELAREKDWTPSLLIRTAVREYIERLDAGATA